MRESDWVFEGKAGWLYESLSDNKKSIKTVHICEKQTILWKLNSI